MDQQQELQKLEQQLKDAHERAIAGDEGAKVEAQNAADAIRRIIEIETTYSEKDAGSVEPLSRGLAAGLAGGTYVVKKGLEGMLNARDERQANIISQAVKQATAEPKASVTVEGAPTPRTATERMMQGTIDPETGATGRARQTSYNQMTSEQSKASAANQATLDKLKRAGLITGENPLLQGPGFTASTPTGISVRPEDLPIKPTTPAAVPTSVPVAEPSFLDKAKIKLMGVANKTVPLLNAAGVGAQGMDVINRAYRGDYPGAVISGIGTVGNYLGTKPGPQMLPGMAVSGLAELANYLMDHPEKRQEILQMLGRIPVSGLANLK
jgi:hypothetical protein